MRYTLACGVAFLGGLVLAQAPPKTPPPRYPLFPLNLKRPPIQPGFNAVVKVKQPNRLDWAFPLPADVPAVTPGHDPTQTTYQLFVPPRYKHQQPPHALIVFVPAGNNPDEFNRLEDVCRKYNVFFACPYEAGNDCAAARRVRLTIEVLEDVRQRFNIDTDRTYLAGFSTGARVASAIAFSYPECVGGVMALSGLGWLRPEGWLRDRVRERLSVAVAYGDGDIARGEVERWRYPVLRDSEVRAKPWTAARTAHALPPTATLEEMFVWLEEARPERAKLALKSPASRIVNGPFPLPDMWAAAVVEEASRRLADRRTRDAGLLQLHGVMMRWKDAPAARRAKKLLDEQEGWRQVVDGQQQRFRYLEARGLDAYLAGTLTPAELLHKKALLKTALAWWEEVEKLDTESKEGKEAARHIGELRRIADER